MSQTIKSTNKAPHSHPLSRFSFLFSNIFKKHHQKASREREIPVNILKDAIDTYIPIINSSSEQNEFLNDLKLADTAWKVALFGVLLVHIFPHSDWMRRNADQNNSKYGQFLRSEMFFLFLKNETFLLKNRENCRSVIHICQRFLRDFYINKLKIS